MQVQKLHTMKMEPSSTVTDPDSATFQKEPVCIPSSNIATEGSQPSNLHSITYQKKLLENVKDSGPIDFSEITDTQDSITRQKEFVKCSRKPVHLVDYTSSSSSTDSEKESLQERIEKKHDSKSGGVPEYMHKEAENVDQNERHLIYSYAISVADFESQTQTETQSTTACTARGNSSMDMRGLQDRANINVTNEINFVNTDLMEEEMYQSTYCENSVVVRNVSPELVGNGSFPSKMDCQSGMEISDIGACSGEITQRKFLDCMPAPEPCSKRIIGLDMNSEEIEDVIYTQHDENTHLVFTHSVSESNIADFVDDSAIVVDEEVNNSGMIDIYASSVIPRVEEAVPQKCGSGSKPYPQSRGNARNYRYESLQRHISCPNDLGYEEPKKHIKFQKISDTAEMPTIADAFTPVTEQLTLHNFLTERSVRNANFSNDNTGNVSASVNSLDRANKGKTPLQVESTPNRWSCSDVKRKNDSKIFLFSKNVNTLRNRPLPAPPSANVDHLSESQAEPGPSRRSPPQLPPKVSKISPHPYKLVSAGKTSRPMLDNLLANDKLFIHYNACLQGYPGWSPRETEYTVSYDSLTLKMPKKKTASENVVC